MAILAVWPAAYGKRGGGGRGGSGDSRGSGAEADDESRSGALSMLLCIVFQRADESSTGLSRTFEPPPPPPPPPPPLKTPTPAPAPPRRPPPPAPSPCSRIRCSHSRTRRLRSRSRRACGKKRHLASCQKVAARRHGTIAEHRKEQTQTAAPTDDAGGTQHE